MEKINLYAAIEQMREISAAGGTFRLKFRKYNRQTNRGGDLAVVEHARVRPKAGDEKIDAASYKLFFTDVDNNTPLNCWIPLIVGFNDKEVELV